VLPAAAAFQRLAPGAPAVPVAVVFSRAYGRRWEQMQRDVAAELGAVAVHATNARHHNIHMTRSDLVVQAVFEVLARPTLPTGE
jgi:hypothetical protein